MSPRRFFNANQLSPFVSHPGVSIQTNVRPQRRRSLSRQPFGRAQERGRGTSKLAVLLRAGAIDKALYCFNTPVSVGFYSKAPLQRSHFSRAWPSFLITRQQVTKHKKQNPDPGHPISFGPVPSAAGHPLPAPGLNRGCGVRHAGVLPGALRKRGPALKQGRADEGETVEPGRCG